MAFQASSFTVVKEIDALKDVPLGMIDDVHIFICPSPYIRFFQGLAGSHQRSNASLAVGIVQALRSSPYLPPSLYHLAIPLTAHPLSSSPSPSAMKSLRPSLIAPDPLPKEIVQGLEMARFPGRCQIVEDSSPQRKGVTWHLDGAHTLESLKCCADWFVDEVSSDNK
jgi:folylpolyglutamate synthase